MSVGEARSWRLPEVCRLGDRDCPVGEKWLGGRGVGSRSDRLADWKERSWDEFVLLPMDPVSSCGEADGEDTCDGGDETDDELVTGSIGDGLHGTQYEFDVTHEVAIDLAAGSRLVEKVGDEVGGKAAGES